MNNPAHWNEVISSSTAYLSDIDPIMARAIERVGLCTLIPNPQLFETLVDVTFNRPEVMNALHAEANGMILPDALLSLEDDTLRAVGLSPQKMRYIRDLTERVVNGELDLERLSELDDEEIIHELVKVKGIGRWTAEMMLIFSLGRPDVLPVDDLGFLEGVREAYSLEARPTPKEMRQRGEVWHPYRTFATWYMWGVQRLKLGNERQKTRIVSL